MINRARGSLEVDDDGEIMSDQLRGGQWGFPAEVREPGTQIGAVGCSIEQKYFGVSRRKTRSEHGSISKQ